MNHVAPIIYEYQGYRYWQERDYEDDVTKIFHEVLTPADDRITLDWSPYSRPSEADFRLWVDLGCPKRITCGPLNSEDLQTIKEGQPKCER